MTKPTPLLDQFFTDQVQTKMNIVSANILDGIKVRLKSKGSITPKQAQWLVEKIKKNQAITHNMADEIISVLEHGTLDDQKLAEKVVRTELVEQPVEQQAKHFDSLFDSETVQLVKELDILTAKFKNKAKL
jgi:hypothetical protein|tara:strand:- start:1945 stop:2337 length:393 start_codon:yes stop_codon:yes gene_type:complete